jgi:hypothetical protein
MSFGASSHSFQVERFLRRMLFVRSGPVRGLFFDDCKETRACSQACYVSIESFDYARASTGTNVNRGPNCSMKLITVQDQ